MEHALVWIRRDLRLQDSVALAKAVDQAKRVTVAFVFDTTILEALRDKDDKRLTFIAGCLRELEEELKGHGSALVVRHGDPKKEIPKLARELKANGVFSNRDYEPSAKARDEAVRDSLIKEGISFHPYKDQVIFEGTEVAKDSGWPYSVFTPYSKKWRASLEEDSFKIWRVSSDRYTPVRELEPFLWDWSLEKVGFSNASLWLGPGTSGARTLWRKFKPRLSDYKKLRDFPEEDATSGLSVHLRFGTISIRSLMRAVYADKGQGAQTWVNELIWREFYQMILDQNPRVVKGAFKPKYDGVNWKGSDAHFEKWCVGQTGYPLVDAAMRHFNKTGWMHNRLRMVVAMFLTKDLLVHWQKGEAYFARKLLDFDLASNNGGWQWSASTGCDAQPYFRIFNPVTQSEKFDPEGKFIRTHLPELNGVVGKALHSPWTAKNKHLRDKDFRLGRDYPEPIVDHSVQRKEAIALFEAIKDERGE